MCNLSERQGHLGTSKTQLVGRRVYGTWHTRQGGGRLWGLGTGHPGTCRGATNCVHGGGDFAPGGFIPNFFRVFGLVPGPREVLKVLLDIVDSSPTQPSYPQSSGGGVRIPGDPLPKLRELITLASFTYGLTYNLPLGISDAWSGLSHRDQDLICKLRQNSIMKQYAIPSP
jgi:hypothetical protein